jgi:transglutaminase-like putative cysteine protease
MVSIKGTLDLLAYTAILLGVAPLFLYLDPPAQIALPLALAAAVFIDRRPRLALSAGAATLLSIAAFVLYAFQISRDHLVEPAVNILALLLAVRLITEKSGRNYLQILVLSVFALAGSSLLTLSVAFFFYLVLLVIVVTVALVLLSFYSADQDLSLGRRQAGALIGVALILPAVSLLLMLVFFFILPRTQHPLWNFLNPAATATAGFTEEVRPGSFAGISAVKETAFRVESEKVPPNELYWRGIVLNTPQGNTWTRQTPPSPARERIVGGRTVVQTIYPEPRSERYIFALDPPRDLEGIRFVQSDDFTFRARRPLDRRVKYLARSAPGGTIAVSGPVDRDFYLRIPPGLSARVRRAAGSIAAGGGSAEETIARLEAFFSAQGLSYATDDLPSSADPVDEFLFEKKRGYCEFFASSFALMLRMAGVPSRLVGGYYGGEYNELGGYYLVTEDAAHVWVEALVGDRWVRIDPSRLAQNADSSLLSFSRRELSLGGRLADAVDYYWNRAVVSYDLGRQVQLLRQTGLQLRRIQAPPDLKTVLPVALGLLAGSAALVFLLRYRRFTPEERLLRKFLRKVRKNHRIGEIPPSVGLEELARQLNDPACREFVEIYSRAVYRDRKLTRGETGKLRKLIRKIRGKDPASG